MLIKRNQLKTVLREKELLSRLNHPNIVRLFGAMKEQEQICLLLEYCPNGDFFHALKRTGKLEEKVAVFCSAELVSGMEYMHQQGIMHRDIKPENILLGPKRHMKLNDFGTAREFSEDVGENAKQPVESTFVGTAEYLSPELINSKPVGKGADLWALGRNSSILWLFSNISFSNRLCHLPNVVWTPSVQSFNKLFDFSANSES